MTSDYVRKYIDQTTLAMSWLDTNSIAKAMQMIVACNGTVWICGNGGSASLAEHFAQDLQKQCKIRAIALTNLSSITAYANDESYPQVFGRQIDTLVKAGDILIVISGSGNSHNILWATIAAHEKGAYVVGLTGFNGGQLRGRNMVDLELNVQSNHMGRSEDGQCVVMHTIVYGIMENKNAK